MLLALAYRAPGALAACSNILVPYNRTSCSTILFPSWRLLYVVPFFKSILWFFGVSYALALYLVASRLFDFLDF